MTQRCQWATGSSALVAYHDHEWGRPVHDERVLFELLSLEIFQAGLSWQTVLNKRAAFRRDFGEFDVARVANFTTSDVLRLCQDPAIIRNRRKIEATINNAQVIDRWSQGHFGSWLWAFVGGQPIRHQFKRGDQVPVTTDLATLISREMKKRGFKFVGPTIIYSFLQAAGLVNDHLLDCDWAPERRKENH